ncbi:MAG: F0F1 ATP synthase subunit epsilon [Planctomycetes bacterium]|nr:F0F1 ATP synthase subunit epsilon [Planctomycetota bacterium]
MTLAVSIITPERTLPAYQADHVTLPAFDGEVGIRTGHAPFVFLLGVGNLSIKSSSQANVVLAVKGGVAQIADNELKILAESVVESDRISEHELVTKLEKLLAKSYEDPLELAEARTQAHWFATQLKLAGKAVPDLSKLGL